MGSNDIEKQEFTSGGITYRSEVIAHALTEPVALSFTPDRRLLIAERAGTVRIVGAGQTSGSIAFTPADMGEEADVVVQSLAVHPHFNETGFVLMLYTALTDSAAVMRLVRLRESGNTLGEPAVLLDNVPSSRQRFGGAVAFGGDRKLYVATNDGDLPSLWDDPAGLSGKLLRLNEDGTTPADNARESPVLAAGLSNPRALHWNPVAKRMWLLEGSTPSRISQPRGSIEVLARDGAVGGGDVRRASIDRTFGDAVFVATEGEVARLHFQRSGAGRLTDRIRLPDWLGAPGAVAGGPDGYLYIATRRKTAAKRPGEDMVVRLVPQVDRRVNR